MNKKNIKTSEKDQKFSINANKNKKSIYRTLSDKNIEYTHGTKQQLLAGTRQHKVVRHSK